MRRSLRLINKSFKNMLTEDTRTQSLGFDDDPPTVRDIEPSLVITQRFSNKEKQLTNSEGIINKGEDLLDECGSNHKRCEIRDSSENSRSSERSRDSLDNVYDGGCDLHKQNDIVPEFKDDQDSLQTGDSSEISYKRRDSTGKKCNAPENCDDFRAPQDVISHDETLLGIADSTDCSEVARELLNQKNEVPDGDSSLLEQLNTVPKYTDIHHIPKMVIEISEETKLQIQKSDVGQEDGGLDENLSESIYNRENIKRVSLSDSSHDTLNQEEYMSETRYSLQAPHVADYEQTHDVCETSTYIEISRNILNQEHSLVTEEVSIRRKENVFTECKNYHVTIEGVNPSVISFTEVNSNDNKSYVNGWLREQKCMLSECSKSNDVSGNTDPSELSRESVTQESNAVLRMMHDVSLERQYVDDISRAHEQQEDSITSGDDDVHTVNVVIQETGKFEDIYEKTVSSHETKNCKYRVSCGNVDPQKQQCILDGNIVSPDIRENTYSPKNSYESPEISQNDCNSTKILYGSPSNEENKCNEISDTNRKQGTLIDCKSFCDNIKSSEGLIINEDNASHFDPDVVEVITPEWDTNKEDGKSVCFRKKSHSPGIIQEYEDKIPLKENINVKDDTFPEFKISQDVCVEVVGKPVYPEDGIVSGVSTDAHQDNVPYTDSGRHQQQYVLTECEGNQDIGVSTEPTQPQREAVVIGQTVGVDDLIFPDQQDVLQGCNIIQDDRETESCIDHSRKSNQQEGNENYGLDEQEYVLPERNVLRETFERMLAHIIEEENEAERYAKLHEQQIVLTENEIYQASEQAPQEHLYQEGNTADVNGKLHDQQGQHFHRTRIDKDDLQVSKERYCRKVTDENGGTHAQEGTSPGYKEFQEVRENANFSLVSCERLNEEEVLPDEDSSLHGQDVYGVLNVQHDILTQIAYKQDVYENKDYLKVSQKALREKSDTLELNNEQDIVPNRQEFQDFSEITVPSENLRKQINLEDTKDYRVDCTHEQEDVLDKYKMALDVHQTVELIGVSREELNEETNLGKGHFTLPVQKGVRSDSREFENVYESTHSENVSRESLNEDNVVYKHSVFHELQVVMIEHKHMQSVSELVDSSGVSQEPLYQDNNELEGNGIIDGEQKVEYEGANRRDVLEGLNSLENSHQPQNQQLNRSYDGDLHERQEGERLEETSENKDFPEVSRSSVSQEDNLHANYCCPNLSHDERFDHEQLQCISESANPSEDSREKENGHKGDDDLHVKQDTLSNYEHIRERTGTSGVTHEMMNTVDKIYNVYCQVQAPFEEVKHISGTIESVLDSHELLNKETSIRHGYSHTQAQYEDIKNNTEKTDSSSDSYVLLKQENSIYAGDCAVPIKQDTLTGSTRLQNVCGSTAYSMTCSIYPEENDNACNKDGDFHNKKYVKDEFEQVYDTCQNTKSSKVSHEPLNLEDNVTGENVTSSGKVCGLIDIQQYEGLEWTEENLIKIGIIDATKHISQSDRPNELIDDPFIPSISDLLRSRPPYSNMMSANHLYYLHRVAIKRISAQDQKIQSSCIKYKKPRRKIKKGEKIHSSIHKDSLPISHVPCRIPPPFVPEASQQLANRSEVNVTVDITPSHKFIAPYPKLPPRPTKKKQKRNRQPSLEPLKKKSTAAAAADTAAAKIEPKQREQVPVPTNISQVPWPHLYSPCFQGSTPMPRSNSWFMCPVGFWRSRLPAEPYPQAPANSSFVPPMMYVPAIPTMLQPRSVTYPTVDGALRQAPENPRYPLPLPVDRFSQFRGIHPPLFQQFPLPLPNIPIDQTHRTKLTKQKRRNLEEVVEGIKQVKKKK